MTGGASLRQWLLAGVCLCLTAAPVLSSDDDPLSAEARAIQSRMARMTHGYASAEAWREILAEVNSLTRQAADNGRPDLALRIRMAEARARAAWPGGVVEAVKVLERARAEFDGASADLQRRALVELAGLYARAGRDEAIRELIREYRTGPLYEAPGSGYRGGRSRDDPLVVMRPHARDGRSSVVETALRKHLREARVGPGHPAPSFQARTLEGREIALRQYRGRPVLLEFWRPGSAPSGEGAASRQRLRQETEDAGLVVIGIAMRRSRPAASDIPGWFDAVIHDPREIPVRYGFAGTTGRVLVGPEGSIMLRNPPLHAVRDAL